MNRFLSCGSRRLDLSRPHVMGVLNLTPDSFYDGGRYMNGTTLDLERALRRAETMVREGASIIDVGAESTRPGAAAVDEQQQIDRVAPVVEAIAGRLDTVISVDTSSPLLMREAARLGAGMINDVRALQRESALQSAASSKLAVCLMHMQGEPRTMQSAPEYTDVVAEVGSFLEHRLGICGQAGISRDRLLIDPGFGFGKTLEHNLALFARLERLLAAGVPLLIGVSRKSMIGQALGRAARDRLAGGLALAVMAVLAGVSVVRTHDVRATYDALRMCTVVREIREKN